MDVADWKTLFFAKLPLLTCAIKQTWTLDLSMGNRDGANHGVMGQKKNEMKIQSYEQQQKMDFCGSPICLLRML